MKFSAPLVIACSLLVPVAWADSMVASDALRQLIDRQVTKSRDETIIKESHPSTQQNHAGRRHESVHPNETLDGLIRRSWPGLPSKDVWVRKTFVDLNPQAFVQGNPNLMQAGAKLVIPSREDLRTSFAATHPHIAALFELKPVAEAPSADGHMTRPAASRWVRYP